MPSTAPSTSTTTRIARLPYLNSAPYFRGLPLGDRFELVDSSPRAMGEAAASGTLLAGLLPAADYLRLEDRFARLGPFGIAVRGRVNSVLLFSRRPVRQLDDATIAVTEDTSTSAVLLRLLLEQRYRLAPKAYLRGQTPSADALVLIGDEALRFRASNTQYPYEIDLAFEWWLWQHLPFVFAVWAIRKDAAPEDRRQVELAVARALGGNQGQLAAIARERALALGLPEQELAAYLGSFIYRLSQPEEAGLQRFRDLAHEHKLL